MKNIPINRPIDQLQSALESVDIHLREATYALEHAVRLGQTNSACRDYMNRNTCALTRIQTEHAYNAQTMLDVASSAAMAGDKFL